MTNNTTRIQHYTNTTLHEYNTTRIQHYTNTTLHQCNTTRIQHYTNTTLHEYNTTRIQHYTNTTLHQYNTTPMQHYTNTTLHQYNATPIQHHTITSLHHYITTPLIIYKPYKLSWIAANFSSLFKGCFFLMLFLSFYEWQFYASLSHSSTENHDLKLIIEDVIHSLIQNISSGPMKVGRIAL